MKYLEVTTKFQVKKMINMRLTHLTLRLKLVVTLYAELFIKHIKFQ